MKNRRYEKLLSTMMKNRLEVLTLTPGPSLFYFTGLQFHVLERPIVLLIAPPHPPTMILPQLEILKAGLSTLELDPVTYGDNPSTWQQAFDQTINSLGLSDSRIGIEPTRLRYLELNFLQKAAPGANFVAAEDILSELRLYKEPEELDAMREAVRIAQDSLVATIPFMKIGRSEKEIANQLTIQLLQHGSEGYPTAPIVSSGPNSANPHATPSKRKLRAGDLIVIDWGATHKGYFSDLTRVFAVGEVDVEFEKIARIVKDANQAASRVVKPGVEIGKIDAAARQVIEAAGYGERFTHRTGHGLGLEVHEGPYVFHENEQIAATGMCFTIEPGIYLPGRGGVRIEDNVSISSEGVEIFSDMPRELIHLS
jgi:Xaa-Pro dipeptidase